MSNNNLLARTDIISIKTTNLIEHYEKTLGAIHVGGLLMVINTNAALKLIDKYFDK